MRTFFASIILFIVSYYTYNQALEQYANSAVYRDKKSFGIGVLFYEKAMQKLKQEPAETNSYVIIRTAAGDLCFKRAQCDTKDFFYIEVKQNREAAVCKRCRFMPQHVMILLIHYSLTGNQEKQHVFI